MDHLLQGGKLNTLNFATNAIEKIAEKSTENPMEKRADYNGLLLPAPPQAEPKPSGVILCDDKVVADTLQCVHGGEHFISIKGSGTKRGFCLRCNGVFCGARHAQCIHFEKRLDNYEKGLGCL